MKNLSTKFGQVKDNVISDVVSDILAIQMCGQRYVNNEWTLDHRKFDMKYTHLFKKLISELFTMYMSGVLSQDSFKEAFIGLIRDFENERLESESLVDILNDLKIIA